MQASRVRVRPPHSHKGLLIFSALSSVALGALYAVVVWNGWFLNLFSTVPSALMAAAGLLPAPVIAFALWLATYCQHKRPLFLSGLLFGSLYVASIRATVALRNAGAEIDPGYVYLLLLAGITVAGLAVGGLNLLLRVVCRSCVFVLLEQDGNLCPRCGYEVGRARSTACPECGASVEPSTPSRGGMAGFVGWLDRRRRVVTVCVLGLLVVVGAYYVWRELPYWRFRTSFQAADHPALPIIQSPIQLQATAAYRVLQDDPEKVVISMLYRRRFLEPARMQVTLGSLDKRGIAYPGSPLVFCELTSRQTRQAFRHGLPTSLVEALLEAADDCGWRPSTKPMFTGWVHNDAVWVEADVHFRSR